MMGAATDGKPDREPIHITIVALARDCERELPDFFTFVRQLRDDGICVRAIVGENGSRDGTRAMLELEASRDRDLILVDTTAMAGIPDRLRRMAFGRDLLTAKIDPSGADKSFVIVADVDGLLRQPPEAAVIRNACTTLQHDAGIAAVSASSHPFYYDLLALRAPGFYDENIGVRINRARRNPINYYLVHRYIYRKQKEVTRENGLRCTSAFNGLCVYRTDDYLSRSYLDDLTVNICEHVPFNQALCAKGNRTIVVSNDICLAMPAMHGPVGLIRFLADRLRKVIGPSSTVAAGR
jgi:hypothetical protein